MRIIGPSIHAAYTSMLRRAEQTAEAILSMQDFMPTLIRTAALNERDYGIFTGKNKRQVLEEYGEETFRNIRRAWDYPIQDGETLKDVHRRVVPFHQNVALPLLS